MGTTTDRPRCTPVSPSPVNGIVVRVKGYCLRRKYWRLTHATSSEENKNKQEVYFIVCGKMNINNVNLQFIYDRV